MPGLRPSPLGRRALRAAVGGALLLLGLAAPPAGTPGAGEEDAYAGPRARMVQVIEGHARSAGAALDGLPLDPRVLTVMGRLPRHAFVPESLRSYAYDDRPLAIGFGQTISQPFIVALMTHLLGLAPGNTVLEVGTGSGYQAAVLGPLARRVCTIEIIPDLGRQAAERLFRLGFGNVEIRVGDGYHGWPECGPFDGIVVTAASSHVPPPLIAQLRPGGRMVIPVGGPFAIQQLMLVMKDAEGRITTRQLLPVAFVPLTREKT